LIGVPRFATKVTCDLVGRVFFLDEVHKVKPPSARAAIGIERIL
jgi:hypothetical protein